MVCNTCGQELLETDKYCGNCGAEITREEQTPSFDNEEIKKAEVFSSSMDQIIPKIDPLSIDFTKEKKDHKKKKTLKICLSLFLIVLIGIIGVVLLSNKKVFYSKTGKRTIMIYMIGSDLESKYLAATKDINEITESSIDYNDINIVIYTGGSKKWHNEEIPNDKHGLFEINSNGLVKIDEFDNTGTMLDKENLLYLLNYGYENYDTEYYDLILWDHGAGPIYGYGYDEYNKADSLSISEIKSALDESSFIGENKLELIGFDACLMSSVEVASTLSTYANYMVASQEFEPGSGWNYRFLEEVDSSTSSQDLGKSIIDYYEDYYNSKDYVKGISLSLLKLNKIDNVIKYTEDLFSKLDNDLVIDYSSISRSRSNSKTYGRIANEDYHYDLVDLNDLISKMPEKYEDEVSNLKTALSDLIIYQKTDLINTNGISIFFPYENQKEMQSNIEKYKELAFSESYYDFITNFSTKLLGSKISEWDLSSSVIESYGEGKVAISLTDEIINNYSKADYIIFEKTSDGLFIPIFNGTDIETSGNKLITTIERKSLTVKDKDGNSMYLTAMESKRGNDYVTYFIPGTVTRFDPDKLSVDVVGIYLEFVVDNAHPNGYVSKVYPIDLNENLTYSKIEIDLKEWDELSLLSYKYNILDEVGNYTPTWQNNEVITKINLPTDEEIKIEFSDLDISKDYYCLFRIKDSQNNTYLSNLVQVNKK